MLMIRLDKPPLCSCHIIETQCEISGCHDGAGEDTGLLGRHSISTGKKLRAIFLEPIALIFLLRHVGRLLLKKKTTCCSETY